jgi:hypothetical protein
VGVKPVWLALREGPSRTDGGLLGPKTAAFCACRLPDVNAVLPRHMEIPAKRPLKWGNPNEISV